MAPDHSDTTAATTAAPEDSVAITERHTLHQGVGILERISFRRRRRDGEVATMAREIFDTGNGASILPYDRERGTIILIRQFRGVGYLKAGRTGLIETCAGKLEGAEPSARILLELEEECGIRLREAPRHLFDAFSSPGSFAERMSFFVAPYRGEDRIGAGGGLAEEGEDIEVIETTLDEALAWVARGDIIDVKTLLHLFHAKATGLMER